LTRIPEHHDRLRQQRAGGGHIEGPQQTAPTAAHLAPRGDRAGRDHRIRKADAAEGRQGVGRQQQRKPELARSRGALEKPHAPTSTLQGHTSGETADAGADDEGCAVVNSQLPTPNFQGEYRKRS
jgi:hypothetical protein